MFCIGQIWLQVEILPAMRFSYEDSMRVGDENSTTPQRNRIPCLSKPWNLFWPIRGATWGEDVQSMTSHLLIFFFLSHVALPEFPVWTKHGSGSRLKIFISMSRLKRFISMRFYANHGTLSWHSCCTVVHHSRAANGLVPHAMVTWECTQPFTFWSPFG